MCQLLTKKSAKKKRVSPPAYRKNCNKTICSDLTSCVRLCQVLRGSANNKDQVVYLVVSYP
jgi:hypothetical protein